MNIVNEITKEATIHLRDYLTPGNIRPYVWLADDLEDWIKDGRYRVRLVSVPGFTMITGNPKYDKPWTVHSALGFRHYKTARGALKSIHRW